MGSIRRFDYVFEDRSQLLQRVPSAIEIHDGESGDLCRQIIVDGGIRGVQSDTPLAVSQFIPDQAGIVYKLLDYSS